MVVLINNTMFMGKLVYIKVQMTENSFMLATHFCPTPLGREVLTIEAADKCPARQPTVKGERPRHKRTVPNSFTQ